MRIALRAHNGGRFLSRGHGKHASRIIRTWELILVLKGYLKMFVGTENFQIPPEHCLLLPPGIRHSFHRTRALQDFISIKFRASLCPERQISRDPVCLFYLDEIRMLIDGKGRFSTHSLESRIVMEHALTGLLQRLTETPEETPLKEQTPHLTVISALR